MAEHEFNVTAGIGLTSSRVQLGNTLMDVGGVKLNMSRTRVHLTDGERTVDVGRPVKIDRQFDYDSHSHGMSWVGNSTYSYAPTDIGYGRSRLDIEVEMDAPHEVRAVPLLLPRRCPCCGRDGCEVDMRERKRFQALGKAA